MSSENQVVPDTTQETMPAPTAPQQQEQVKLVDATINNQHVALNVLVGFIGVAQRRGTFALDESAKIYECIKMFQGTGCLQLGHSLVYNFVLASIVQTELIVQYKTVNLNPLLDSFIVDTGINLSATCWEICNV